MHILVEVVATNMDSGHVAVHQEAVPIQSDFDSEKQMHDFIKSVKASVRANNEMEPKKVGPVLIIRNMTFFTDVI